MPWRVTLEVLCNVHAATFKFRNRVVVLISEIDVYAQSLYKEERSRLIANNFLQLVS